MVYLKDLKILKTGEIYHPGVVFANRRIRLNVKKYNVVKPGTNK